MVVFGSDTDVSALHGLEDAAEPCAAGRTNPASERVAATTADIRQLRNADERYLHIVPPFERSEPESGPLTPTAAQIAPVN